MTAFFPPGSVLAHGIGERSDLPIPAFYAFVAALAALFLSFLGLAALWAESRFRGPAAGLAVPRLERVADSRAVRLALRGLGLIAGGYTAIMVVFGPPGDKNPAPWLVYVIFWVGLVPASLLLGPVWRLVNPLRTLHQLIARPATHRPIPDWIGYRPAAIGLLAFTWMELVAPAPAAPGTLAAFLGVYVAVHLAASLVYGSRWFDRGDAFEVYSALIGSLSFLGRRSDGRLVIRSPFNGLDALTASTGGALRHARPGGALRHARPGGALRHARPGGALRHARPGGALRHARPGLVATVSVLLGSTAYDGFSGAPAWVNAMQSAPIGPTAMGTIGLLTAITLVAGLYTLCAGLALRRGRPGTASPESAPAPASPGARPGSVSARAAFAHTLIPIAVGYLIAHYFSLLVIEGQRAVILTFGLSTTVDESIVSPGVIALIQVLAIVAGHVIGVVAAHDRSVRLLPPSRAVSGQIPLFILMVVYTLGGLTLLIAA